MSPTSNDLNETMFSFCTKADIDSRSKNFLVFLNWICFHPRQPWPYFVNLEVWRERVCRVVKKCRFSRVCLLCLWNKRRWLQRRWKEKSPQGKKFLILTSSISHSFPLLKCSLCVSMLMLLLLLHYQRQRACANYFSLGERKGDEIQIRAKLNLSQQEPDGERERWGEDGVRDARVTKVCVWEREDEDDDDDTVTLASLLLFLAFRTNVGGKRERETHMKEVEAG